MSYAHVPRFIPDKSIDYIDRLHMNDFVWIPLKVSLIQTWNSLELKSCFWDTLWHLAIRKKYVCA